VTRGRLLLAAALVCAGCSKPPLGPAAAGRLIEEAPDFREPSYLAVGRQECLCDCKSKLEQDPAWRALAKAGWAEVRNEDDFKRAEWGRPATKCVGALTGDGLRAGAAIDTTTYAVWRVPVAARELVTVTSVTSASGGISTVRFKFRWRRSAFGVELYRESKESAGEAVFRLLDDGWHVANFTSLPGYAAVRLEGEGQESPQP
jgi:hypothetical protein